MRIIRGIYGRRRFDVPPGIKARPTTDFAKENIFNVIENLADIEDANVLDLFAGTGAISYEFASRGAKMVTTVEKAAPQHAFIRQVIDRLGAENIRPIKGDALKYAQTATQQFDIIFADPPYDLPEFERVPELVLASPMMGPNTLFVLEHGKTRSYQGHPWLIDHRQYGSVNFSIFRKPESENTNQ